MAKPKQIGQIVRWLHYPTVMRVKQFTDAKPEGATLSVSQSALCEWLTTDGVYQSAKFAISELEVFDLPMPFVPSGK